ncbi:hypothetical protein MIR68_004036 [Amoeboaphelidium protococcarum]|nr:hypothetical protein MIR68_004036 [Amoeboaphelidium protococcarum]
MAKMYQVGRFQRLLHNIKLRYLFGGRSVLWRDVSIAVLTFILLSLIWSGSLSSFNQCSTLWGKDRICQQQLQLDSSLPFGGVASKSTFDSLEDLIKSSAEIVNICHPEWHGIRQATYGQGYPVLEIPGLLNDLHEVRLMELFSSLSKLRTVIVNGIPHKMIEFAYILRHYMPNIQIIFIYHGSISQPFHEAEASLVNDMIIAAQEGVIDRVGVVKNGIENSFKAMGVDVVEIWNFPDMPIGLRSVNSVLNVRALTLMNSTRAITSVVAFDPSVRNASKLQYHTTYKGPRWNVGVFGSSWNHKNVFVQIMALCRIPNIKIHVLEKPKLPYLEHCQSEIISHGRFIPHEEFIQLIQSMDINLYVSLTECFPMTIIESITVGIPALTSATSPIYTLDPMLQQFLVINELDSPDYIADAVIRIMQNYGTITDLLWNYMPYLHMKAREQMEILLYSKADFNVPTVPTLDDSVKKADPKPEQPVKKQQTVCLITDGVFPHVLSEVSVVAHSAVTQYVSDGFNVILLVIGNSFNSNGKDGQSVPGKDRVQIVYLQRILEQSKLKFRDDLYNLVAAGLQLLYQNTPFDIVEFPDTYGLAYEILHRQGDPELALKHCLFYQSVKDYLQNCQQASSSFLSNVKVVIRSHGTIQMQHLSAGHWDERRSLSMEHYQVYMKEQYSILTADTVIASSVHDALQLQGLYGLPPSKISVQSLPYPHLELLLNGMNSGETIHRNKGRFVITMYDPFASVEAYIKAMDWLIEFVDGILVAINRGKFNIQRSFVYRLKVVIINPRWNENAAWIAINNYTMPEVPHYLTKYFEVYHDLAVDEALKLVKASDYLILPPQYSQYHFTQNIAQSLKVKVIGPVIDTKVAYSNVLPDVSYSVKDHLSFKSALNQTLTALDQSFHGQQTKSSVIKKDVVNTIDLKYEQSQKQYRFAGKQMKIERSFNSRAEWIRSHIESLQPAKK